MKYISLTHNAEAANCPHCGAYSKMEWNDCNLNNRKKGWRLNIESIDVAICTHCEQYSIWILDDPLDLNNSFTMLYPNYGNVPQPNDDLTESIKNDYLEAASIVNLSPRGAVAILRLALQKLCKEVGENGENINADIKSLVSKGLNPVIQQALDSVRVTGNNAVHPGVLDLKDDRETAIKIFGFINIIAEALITQPKQIGEFYDLKLPNSDKVAIEKRDNK
ncbi:DUF4145 domain-containing protein [Sphingobacterium cellulitidis]|uniref:DUF4145 domain-containing protein n=1 Tax=Sphingobacterium cellulitidis TaxID=1768011 RepID=UPI00370DA3A9